MQAKSTATFGFLILGCLVWACGGSKKNDTHPDVFADYQDDPNLFMAPVTADELVEQDGLTMASNQVLVLMGEQAQDADIANMAASVGATLVGQVPAIGLYQLGVADSSYEELVALTETLNSQPGVEGALPNFVSQGQTVPAYCQPTGDFAAYDTEDSRCFLYELQYNLVAPLMGKIEEHQTLAPVKVAVLDVGVAESTGQFDELGGSLNVDAPSSPCAKYEQDGHGTRVAGIIVADPNDGGAGGLASTILGDKVSLICGGTTDWFDEDGNKLHVLQSLGNDMLTIARAARAGAQVVNISIGLNFYGLEVVRYGYVANLAFARSFKKFDQALYVIAAGNEALELTTSNYAPLDYDGSVQSPGKLDNVLSVGSTEQCLPDKKAHFSNYGQWVDIYGPGRQIPVINYFPDANLENPNEITRDSGTSLTSPIVASLAVLLKSVNPELTPAQLKNYILDNASLVSNLVIHYTEGNLVFTDAGLRLLMAPAIAQVVIDNPLTKPKLLEYFLAYDAEGRPLEPPEAQDPAEIVNQICGDSQLTIQGSPTLQFPPEDSAGFITDEGIDLTFTMEEPEDHVYTVQIGFAGDFHLKQEYVLDQDAGFTYLEHDGTENMINGSASGGLLKFTACEITERDGFTDNPMVVELAGMASGMLDLAESPSGNVWSMEFTMGFNSMVMALWSGESPLIENLESECLGGRNFTPAP